MLAWEISLLQVVFCVLLLCAAGCASHQEGLEPEEPASIERPAVPLEEEETASSRAGEIAIVVLGVCFLVGGIVAGILLGTKVF